MLVSVTGVGLSVGGLTSSAGPESESRGKEEKNSKLATLSPGWLVVAPVWRRQHISKQQCNYLVIYPQFATKISISGAGTVNLSSHTMLNFRRTDVWLESRKNDVARSRINGPSALLGIHHAMGSGLVSYTFPLLPKQKFDNGIRKKGRRLQK